MTDLQIIHSRLQDAAYKGDGYKEGNGWKVAVRIRRIREKERLKG